MLEKIEETYCLDVWNDYGPGKRGNLCRSLEVCSDQIISGMVINIFGHLHFINDN